MSRIDEIKEDYKDGLHSLPKKNMMGMLVDINDLLSALTSAQERIKELEEMIKDSNDDKRFAD